MSARGRVKSGCGPRSGSRAAESSPICSNRAYATARIDARTDVGKLSLHSKLIVVLLIGISLNYRRRFLGERYGVYLRCVTGCRRRESLSGLYDKEEMEG